MQEELNTIGQCSQARRRAFFIPLKNAQMERDKDQKKILEYGMELSYLATLKASSLVSDAEYSVILEAINDAYSGCIKKVKGNGEKNEIE